MEIVNKVSGEVLSGGAQLRDTFWGRFRGLMLSEKGDAILACNRESVADATIHMMFMLYPIDVAWVDSAMKVVDTARVEPFNPLKPRTVRVYSPRKPAKYVIELGAGRIGETKAGDYIEFR